MINHLQINVYIIPISISIYLCIDTDIIQISDKYRHICLYTVFLVTQMVENLPAMQKTQVQSWVGKIHWRSELQLTPIFLPEYFHDQRNLAGYSPWGLKESDTTERLTLSLSDIYNYLFIYLYHPSRNRERRA